jgi:hypothetical protein
MLPAQTRLLVLGCAVALGSAVYMQVKPPSRATLLSPIEPLGVSHYIVYGHDGSRA